MPHRKVKSNASVKFHPSSQNIKIAVDNCIFTVREGQLQVLLIQMKKNPFMGQWALPGGLMLENESLDTAAERILKEETAVSRIGAHLEQLWAFGDLKRDPFGRVISVAYMALIPSEGVKLCTVSRYADVRWHDVRKLAKLAYDHTDIISIAKKELAKKLISTNIAWSLLSKTFTLTELQKVYEAVLGRGLDKRNFRKKILSLNIIQPAGKQSASGAWRPAMLYRFRTHATHTVDVL